MVGRKIAESAGKYLKPVMLELGGKAPVIVCADADIEKAAKGAAFGAFHHVPTPHFPGGAALTRRDTGRTDLYVLRKDPRSQEHLWRVHYRPAGRIRSNVRVLAGPDPSRRFPKGLLAHHFRIQVRRNPSPQTRKIPEPQRTPQRHRHGGNYGHGAVAHGEFWTGGDGEGV